MLLWPATLASSVFAPLMTALHHLPVPSIPGMERAKVGTYMSSIYRWLYPEQGAGGPGVPGAGSSPRPRRGSGRSGTALL